MRSLHGSKTGRLVTCTAVLVAVVAGSTVAAQASPQPPKRVTVGPATITNVKVNGGSTNYVIPGNAADHVTVSGNFSNADDSGAIDQLQIGWAGSPAPLGCLSDGVGPQRGRFSFDLGAPPRARSNRVVVNFAQDFSCNTTAWWTSNAGPVIAEVAVPVAPTGRAGALTVSRVLLNEAVGNTRIAAPGTAVTASGSFTVADTGGVSAYVVVGWLGAKTPTKCIYSGPSAVTRNFVVDLGAPPRTGANYVVFAHGPGGCVLNGWPRGTSSPPRTVAAALVYIDRDR